MKSFPPVSPGLERVATLERQIDASLERVWENVRDWEHLPWLHRRDFASIELVEEGSWGWRARTESTTQPGQPVTVELKINYPKGHYVTRTLDGPLAQTEIWTRLEAQGPDATSIRVEFWVPAAPGLNRERMGQGYLSLYQRLWSEDETMMRQRTRALQLKPKEKVDADSSLQLELGPLRKFRRAFLSAWILRATPGGSARSTGNSWFMTQSAPTPWALLWTSPLRLANPAKLNVRGTGSASIFGRAAAATADGCDSGRRLTLSRTRRAEP